MTPRSQLETRIAERLAILSDADMQRVAEDYARLRFPDRFPHFDFRAFSAEGKSRPGWPDAWITLPDGRIDGVEATGSKNKSSVLKHLKKDIEKARRHDPKLAGFILVSGHPAVQPNDQELNALRQRFIDEAGIDPDRIDLIFGGRLVQELAGPEFARTRIEVLKLRNQPHYFKLVRADLPPDEGRLNSDFIPSPEDYASGRVHRPEVADKVLTYLERDGRTLVRGIGASGKSVMAWLLALEATNRRRPAYYLDLAPIAGSEINIGNLLAEDLQGFGHPDTLFVLDNIHLNESLAKQVALDWADLAPIQRPRLLLLGRELRTGRGSPITGLAIPTLPLKARQAEVLGVYRRLVWRRGGGTAPPEPPADVLDRWVATFGGDPASPDTTTDLIAVSAAVLRRLPKLLLNDWTLSVEDAIDEIREVYLDKLSDGETRNLIRLCVLAEVELNLHKEALADWRADFKRAGRSLGLVFRESVGKSQQWVHYRLAHAALGNLILTAAHERVDVVAERRDIALAYPFLGFVLSRSLHNYGETDEAQKIVSELLLEPRRLLELGQLQYVHNAFRLAQQQLSITLSSDLGKRLAVADNRQLLLERALLTPLGDLQAFLAYAAKPKELRPVFEALATDLALPDNRAPLLERALLTPLGHLQTFLAYAAKTTELRPVFKTLAADLALPDNRAPLLARFQVTPLGELVNLLSSNVAADLWNVLLQDLNGDEWTKSRSHHMNMQISAFGKFAQMVFQRGRPELAEGLALSLAHHSTAEQWHQPVIGLHHLSHVLRCAHAASRSQIQTFLERVATADWVEDQITNAPRGGLAGTLLALATTLDQNLRPYFARNALQLRVVREITRIGTQGTKSQAESLSLLGAAVAMGIHIPRLDIEWPDTADLATILDLRSPDPDQTTIGYLQIQLWLGLREMARIRDDDVFSSPKLSEAILFLWQTTQENETGGSLPPHALALNAEMINWLEHCRAYGWRLVSPQTEPSSGEPDRQP